MSEAQKQITDHLIARALYLSQDLNQALKLIESQIRRKANLAASYGLLARIRLAQYEKNSDHTSASAQLLLQQARTAIANCEAQSDHDSNIVEELKSRVAEIGTSI